MVASGGLGGGVKYLSSKSLTRAKAHNMEVGSEQ